MKVLIFDNDYYNGDYVIINHAPKIVKTVNGVIRCNENSLPNYENHNWLHNENTVIESAVKVCPQSIIDYGELFEPEMNTGNTSMTTQQIVGLALIKGLLFDCICDVNSTV
jgi:hypothetical protein